MLLWSVHKGGGNAPLFFKKTRRFNVQFTVNVANRTFATDRCALLNRYAYTWEIHTYVTNTLIGSAERTYQGWRNLTKHPRRFHVHARKYAIGILRREAGITVCTCELLSAVLNDSTSFIYSGNENPNRLSLRCYIFLPGSEPRRARYLRTYLLRVHDRVHRSLSSYTHRIRDIATQSSITRC